MNPRLGATRARWLIVRDHVECPDSVVVSYHDLVSNEALGLAAFDATVDDETVINWIIDEGRIRIADEIMTAAGDLLVWLPTGMRVRRLKLADGTTFQTHQLVAA